jgi:hypothetical protein
MLPAAAITVAAGLAVALVVARPDGSHWDPPVAHGTVAREPAVTPRALIEAPGEGGSANAASRKPGVRVGSVGGLYPGHRVALGVRYVNSYSFPFVIDTVRARTDGTSLCTARQLMRPRRSRHVRVPAGSSVVRFALHVQVTAVKL